jgi:hypothetical protein
MKKLALDFDFTILAPLVLGLLIILWNAIRVYRRPTEELWEREPMEEESGRAAWKIERQHEKRKAKDVMIVSGIVLPLLFASALMSDRWKLDFGYFAWQGLAFISWVSLIFAACMVWHYSRKQQRLKLIVCLVAMLLSAASMEHFYHQSMNSGRIVCPHCKVDIHPEDQ